MTKEVVNQLGLKKYEYEYRNPLSDSYFNLFSDMNNKVESLDDEFDNYEVDITTW